MSVLGIAWTKEKGIQLSCRPNPIKPACLLESLCEINISQDVIRKTIKRKKNTILMADLLNSFLIPNKKDLFDFNLDEFKSTVIEYFLELLQLLESTETVRVIMIEEIDHLVFILPVSTRTSRIKDFTKIVEQIPKVRSSVIAYPTAFIAFSKPQFVSDFPYILFEWDEDLLISTAFSYDSLKHFTRTGKQYRLIGVGIQKWSMLIEKKIEKDYGIVCLKNNDKKIILVNKTHLYEEINKTIYSILSGQSEVTLLLEGTSFDKGEIEDQITKEIIFSKNEIHEILAPVLRKVKNFIHSYLSKLMDQSNKTIVVAGHGFDMFFESLRLFFGENNFPSLPETMTNTSILGLHNIVKTKPILPYDCGVLIRREGEDIGIGTLILVRPTRVGQKRESEVIEVPLNEHLSADIAFYYRMFDLENKKIQYLIFKSHLIALSKDEKGFSRIRVEMKVESDGDINDHNLATVSISLFDMISKEKISFEHLKLDSGKRMRRPPMRNYNEVKGAALAMQFQPMISSVKDDLPIKEWRKKFDNKSRLNINSRNDYIMHYFILLNDITSKNISLLEMIKVKDDPETVQSKIRILLFSILHEITAEIKQVVKINKNIDIWTDHYPFNNNDPGINIQVAQNFVNAASQDISGHQDEDLFIRKIKRIIKLYKLACANPYHLNIDWSTKNE